MRILLFALLLILSSAARAVEPNEMLQDPALEARARLISKDLRCLVCQGEDIDDSNAELARDLRLLVRERLTAGDTDAQVKQFLRQRYGDFILLRPPVEGKTALLWLTPLIMLLIGGGTVAVYIRKRRGRE